jgi:hypothetical protein
MLPDLNYHPDLVPEGMCDDAFRDLVLITWEYVFPPILCLN